MIRDYESILSNVRLSGEAKRNRFGSLSVISNTLPEVEGINKEEYEGISFLDIETTGLSGVDQPLFLIGILRHSEEELICSQLFARDPSEEGAILFELLSHIRSGSTVMTFNGDSFDLPYISKRMGLCNISLPAINSVDLLIPARRRYGKHLPSCSLQSLERNVLQLSEANREDDIPGMRIPRVYWDYVNSNEHRLVTPIIRHNIMDLISTARLWGLLKRPQ